MAKSTDFLNCSAALRKDMEGIMITNTNYNLSHTKKRNLEQQQQRSQHQSKQTAAELGADSMFNNSLDKDDDKDTIYRKQNILHTRLTTHLQERQNNYNKNFDTYPPKRNYRKKSQTQNNSSSLSTSNILQTTTTLRRAMYTGRTFTKRSTKRSFSESSAEKLHRYTTSDSSTSQEEEEDEIMMSTADKRKMTRRSLSSGLQHHHSKYQHHQMPQRNQRITQSLDAEDDGGSAFGCATLFGKHAEYVSDLIDIGIRVVLVVVFSKLETQTAFTRVIHKEEMWMYKNPRTKDYVSPLALLLAVIFGPFFITLIHSALTKDRRDFRAASWAWTLILGLNGLATSLLKISVGRPRPDFYYRCFPDGVMQLSHNGTGVDNMLELFNCTGNIREINEGLAFAGFGFITYYVGAKLHAFNHRGRGESWRLCVAITPLVLAALIAVSRTCDYHHHWEDVTIGSLIGLVVSYYIYRQYYPSIFSPHCHRAYPRGSYNNIKTMPEQSIITTRNRRRLHSYKRVPSEECGEASLLCEAQNEGFSAETDKRPLISEQKTENKWF
ncbi:Phospholipid phosphatase 4 [Lucilia cuprina]|nr:Phospholipid phosphatase 4 [Lucilia cuprina]